MANESINIELIEVALDRVEGSAFEKFFHAFYPSIAGEEFVPISPLIYAISGTTVY